MVEKVGSVRPTVASRAARRAGGVGASGFSSALSHAEAALEISESDAVESLSALSATTGLLGFQEVGADEFDRRKAFKKGKLTLEALAQLRDALLMGSLPIATIERLEQIVIAERGTTTDPVLNDILDQIELRAAVELAKIEVALEAGARAR